jgi:foldase protein PrsA
MTHGRVIGIYMRNRCISALIAIAVAVVGVTACGGGNSDEVVARVAGVGSINKATLDHWIPVEAVLLYQQEPTSPVPKGVIPDPPDYTACIAYLGSLPQKIGENGPKPTVVQLKGRCVQRSRELKVITLNTLIGWDWTIGAGLALGMKVSDAEVRKRLEEVNKRIFPTKAQFANYLKITRQTVTDMLFRSRVQLFEAKLIQERAALEKRLPSGLPAQQRQAAIAKFMKSISPGKEWAAKTSCREGYVVSACKEYKGSLPPGIPN